METTQCLHLDNSYAVVIRQSQPRLGKRLLPREDEAGRPLTQVSARQSLGHDTTGLRKCNRVCGM
jgi:hypothetical protein